MECQQSHKAVVQKLINGFSFKVTVQILSFSSDLIKFMYKLSVSKLNVLLFSVTIRSNRQKSDILTFYISEMQEIILNLSSSYFEM